jgi:phage terminase large subunit-like protein
MTIHLDAPPFDGQPPNQPMQRTVGRRVRTSGCTMAEEPSSPLKLGESKS